MELCNILLYKQRHAAVANACVSTNHHMLTILMSQVDVWVFLLPELLCFQSSRPRAIDTAPSAPAKLQQITAGKDKAIPVRWGHVAYSLVLR